MEEASLVLGMKVGSILGVVAMLPFEGAVLGSQEEAEVGKVQPLPVEGDILQEEVGRLQVAHMEEVDHQGKVANMDTEVNHMVVVSNVSENDGVGDVGGESEVDGDDVHEEN